MQLFWLCACGAVVSYLCGGVNSAILLSKAIYHEDIRQSGSGNPGFTNFKRVYGSKYAWFVFIGDLLKTVLPSLLLSLAAWLWFDAWQLGAAVAGFFTMLGHCYPVWYKLRGGKAFSCAVASVWFVDWRVGLIFAAVFALLLFTVKIMSVSSMSAASTVPIMLAILGVSHPAVLVFSTAGAALVIWRHRANIARLVRGEEPKFHLRSKKTGV